MPGWEDTGEKESRVSPEVLCNINQRSCQECMEASIGNGLGWEMNVHFSQIEISPTKQFLGQWSQHFSLNGEIFFEELTSQKHKNHTIIEHIFLSLISLFNVIHLKNYFP